MQLIKGITQLMFAAWMVQGFIILYEIGTNENRDISTALLVIGVFGLISLCCAIANIGDYFIDRRIR